MLYVSNVDNPQDRWDLARAVVHRAERLMLLRHEKNEASAGAFRILISECKAPGARWMIIDVKPGFSVSARFDRSGLIENVYVNEALTERELIHWREILDRELLLDELAHA